MAPPPPLAACINCGSLRWKRAKQGGYVCNQGHSSNYVEEVDDTDPVSGVMTRSIRTSRKRSKRAKIECVSPRSQKLLLGPCFPLLQFQNGLKEQVKWIVKEKGFPVQLEYTVRDLWLLWLKKFGAMHYLPEFPPITDSEDDLPHVPLFKTRGKSSKIPYNLSNLISASWGLIFIHLAAFSIKQILPYCDLMSWACMETYPYFSLVTKERFHLSFYGGYSVFLDLVTLPSLEVLLLNQLIQAGFQITFQLDQPLFTYRLFKELELPVECYPYYKTISGLLGNSTVHNVAPKNAYLHVGVACLWVARAYYNKSKLNFSGLDATCLAFGGRPPPDIRFPFLSSNIVLLKQKNDDGISKVAAGIFNDIFVNENESTSQDNSFQNQPSQTSETTENIRHPFPEHVHSSIANATGELENATEELENATEELGNATEGLENATEGETKGPEYHAFSFPLKLKSYIGVDPDGALDPTFATLLVRTSLFVGVEPNRLLLESRNLDIVLQEYSRYTERN